MRCRLNCLLPLLLGCGDDSSEPTDATDRLDALEAKVDALQTDNDALLASVASLELQHAEQEDVISALTADNDALLDAMTTLEDEVDALSGIGDLTGLLEDVAQNTDDITAIASDYLTSSALSDYAPSADVEANAADIATNAAGIAAIASDYLTSSDLSGYATESWVSGQG